MNSGGTDLQGGTLQLANGATLGSGSLTVNGGTLDLNGNSITVASLGGSGGLITNSQSASTSTLTVDESSDTTYCGEIQDGDGAVGLDISGSASLCLTGNNVYSAGATVANGGTLAVTVACALADARPHGRRGRDPDFRSRLHACDIGHGPRHEFAR